jgi:hypothetical protein
MDAFWMLDVGKPVKEKFSHGIKSAQAVFALVWFLFHLGVGFKCDFHFIGNDLSGSIDTGPIQVRGNPIQKQIGVSRGEKTHKELPQDAHGC